MELGLGDRTDGPEQLGGEVVQRIAPQPHLLDAHARELVLALGKEVVDVVGDVGLDRDVRVGQQRVLLGDRARDRREPGVDDVRAADDRAAPALRRDREHLSEAGVHPAAFGAIARQVGRRELHCDRRLGIHEDVAVAVEDLAPRGRDRQRPHPVDARLRQVLIAAQHLEEPQAEEDDREHRERDAADDRHAQRELRRQRRTSIFGGLHHRVAERGIWPRSDGRWSGLSPPVV